MPRGYRFVVDEENTTSTWWDAARARADIPAELAALLADPLTTTVFVPSPRAWDVARWAEHVPGWDDDTAPDHAPHPLVIFAAEADEP